MIPSRRASTLLAVFAMVLLAGPPVGAQVYSTEVISVARGASALVTPGVTIQRVSIGDPAIADAIVISPREVLVNALAIGSTSLIIWDANNNRRLYTVEVTADVATLQRQIRSLFPGEPITVTASGNVVILSGEASDALLARRALEIAQSTGATVINNLNIPPAQQILLQVRFAEVTQRALDRIGTELSVLRSDGSLGPDETLIETFSEGLVRLLLFEDDIRVSAVLEALQQDGTFRTLAEPNLLAIEGTEASFLAGGEFPYPVPRMTGGAESGITIEFKEYGVRLNFTPRITNAGNIRLDVAPEVSQLDLSNAVQFAGFAIPALITRRAETAIELRDGQTFAIAGLLDNSMQSTQTKIPFLGDLPILGPLFRSRNAEQRRTELLVLVTPRIVEPRDTPPPVPTGEPQDWPWDRKLRNPPGGTGGQIDH